MKWLGCVHVYTYNLLQFSKCCDITIFRARITCVFLRQDDCGENSNENFKNLWICHFFFLYLEFIVEIFDKKKLKYYLTSLCSIYARFLIAHTYGWNFYFWIKFIAAWSINDFGWKSKNNGLRGSFHDSEMIVEIFGWKSKKKKIF